MTKKLLIFGNGEIAKLASEFIEVYTKYEIHGFVVDSLSGQTDKYFEDKKNLTKDINDFPPEKYLIL